MNPSVYQIVAKVSLEEIKALNADMEDRGVLLVPVEYDEHGNILDGHREGVIAITGGIAMTLTAKGRARIKPSNFAFPSKRAYPINTIARARNALARVAQHGTPSQQRTVQRAVARRWPSIDVTKAGKR
ncbi:hypothetical protein AB4Y45_25515 [Paraburkholderia sp. EG287A]|uniref:hypothetical protein n=1 Tax=unclassified Paraburkholderia TaxID=2615204 RepID=UPI0034D1EA00